MAEISKNGDVVRFKLCVYNDSIHVNTNVYVLENPPAGLQFMGIATPFNQIKGSFNATLLKWVIGTMQPYEKVCIELLFKVVDIDIIPIGAQNCYTVFGDLNESTNIDNTSCEDITFTTCPPAIISNTNDFACVCGTVSISNSGCSRGITEWVLDASSVINSTNYTWDNLTGDYHFIHDDPREPITFCFTIRCKDALGNVLNQTDCPVCWSIPNLYEDEPSFDPCAPLETATDFVTLVGRDENGCLTDLEITDVNRCPSDVHSTVGLVLDPYDGKIKLGKFVETSDVYHLSDPSLGFEMAEANAHISMITVEPGFIPLNVTIKRGKGCIRNNLTIKHIGKGENATTVIRIVDADGRTIDTMSGFNLANTGSTGNTQDLPYYKEAITIKYDKDRDCWWTK